MEKPIPVNIQNYQCTLCKKMFRFKIGLNKHIQERHINLPESRVNINIVKKSTCINHEDMYAHENSVDRKIMNNVLERNGSECLDKKLASNSFNSNLPVEPSNIITNSSDFNIKQEYIPENENEKNNSCEIDALNRMNELNVLITPNKNDVKLKELLKKNYGNMCLVRETKYFSIKKLFCVENVPSVSTALNHEHSSKSYVIIYTCSICKKLSEDLHSIALHISFHNECTMHECFVCDETFSSIVVWAKHMTHHQDQVKFNLSYSHIKSPMVEPSENIITDTMSNEHQVGISILRNTRNNSSLVTGIKDLSVSNLTPVKNLFNCEICKSVFSSKLDLIRHRSIHIKPRPFLCKYCDKTFFKNSSLNKHVKTVHIYNKNKDTVKYHEEQVNNPSSSNNEVGNIIDYNKLSTEISDDALTRRMTTRSSHNVYNTNHIKSHNLIECNKVSPVKINENKKHLQGKNHNSTKLVTRSINKSNIKNSTNANRLWFPCDLCEVEYLFPMQLIEHRKLHGDIEPYLCKICNKSFNVKFYWNRHLKFHYSKIIKSKSKQKTKALKLDTRTLKKTRSKALYSCRNCKKGYNFTHHLKRHLTQNKECYDYLNYSTLVNQNGKKFTFSPLECYICKKTFHSIGNRNKHIKNIHKQAHVINLNINASTNAIKQKKKLNTKTIKKNSKLRNLNKSNMISNNTKKVCKDCGKSFWSNNNLYRHQKIIHKIDDVVIKHTIRNKALKQKYTPVKNLNIEPSQLSSNKSTDNKHIEQQIKSIKICDLAIYLCKICRKQFPDNDKLMNHLKVHTASMYECQDCQLLFKINLELAQHILNNHADKSVTEKTSLPPINENLKCKICLKVFKSSSYLSIHMRIHNGDKPLKCDVCNKYFRFKQNLRIHKKRVHNIY